MDPVAIRPDQGHYQPHPHQLEMMGIGSLDGAGPASCPPTHEQNVPGKGSPSPMFQPYREDRFTMHRADDRYLLHSPGDSPSSSLAPQYIKQIDYGGLAGLQDKVKMADPHSPGRDGNMFQPYKNDGSGGYISNPGHPYMKQGYIYGSLALQDKLKVADLHGSEKYSLGHVFQPYGEVGYSDRVASSERHLQALGAATTSTHASQYVSQGSGYMYGSPAALQDRPKMTDVHGTGTSEHRAVDRNVHDSGVETSGHTPGYEKERSYVFSDMPPLQDRVKGMDVHFSGGDKGEMAKLPHSLPGGPAHSIASGYLRHSNLYRSSTVENRLGLTGIPVSGRDAPRQDLQPHTEGKFVGNAPSPATQYERESDTRSPPTESVGKLMDVHNKMSDIEGNHAGRPCSAPQTEVSSEVSSGAPDRTNVTDASGRVVSSSCVNIQPLKRDSDSVSDSAPQLASKDSGVSAPAVLNKEKMSDHIGRLRNGGSNEKKMSDNEDDDTDDGSSEDSDDDSSDDTDDDSDDGSLSEDSEAASDNAQETPAPRHQERGDVDDHKTAVDVLIDKDEATSASREKATPVRGTHQGEDIKPGVTAEHGAISGPGLWRGTHRKVLPYKKNFIDRSVAEIDINTTVAGSQMPQSKQLKMGGEDRTEANIAAPPKEEKSSGQVPQDDSGVVDRMEDTLLKEVGGQSDLQASEDSPDVKTEEKEITKNQNTADGGSDAPVTDYSPKRVTKYRERRVVVATKVEECSEGEESIERDESVRQTEEVDEYAKPRDPRLRPRRKRTLVIKFAEPEHRVKLRRSPRKQERPTRKQQRRPIKKRMEHEPAEPKIRQPRSRPIKKEKPVRADREQKERRPRGRPRSARKAEKPRQYDKKRRTRRVEYQWKDMPISYICKVCEHRPRSLGMACVHLLQVHQPITVPLYDYLISEKIPRSQRTLHSYILEDLVVDNVDDAYPKDVPMEDDGGNIMVIGATEDDMKQGGSERYKMLSDQSPGDHELTNHEQVDSDRDYSQSGAHLATDDPGTENEPTIKIELLVKNETVVNSGDGKKDCEKSSVGKPFQESSLLEFHEFVTLLIRWLDINAVCPKCNCRQRGRKMTHVHHCRAMGLQKLCETCGKYIHNHSFKSHVAREHDHVTKIRRVVCPHCQKEMSTTTISHHVKTFHQGGVVKVPCGICGKLLSSNHSLKRHEAIHRADVRYHCPVCKRGFTQSTNMKNHMRQHTGEQPYKCEFCGKSFTHKVSMKTHLKKHHGIDLWKDGHTGGGRPKKEPTDDFHEKQETRVDTMEKMQDLHPHSQLVERATFGHGVDPKQDCHPQGQLVGRADFVHGLEQLGHLHSQSGETQEHTHRHAGGDERSRVELMEDFHLQAGTRAESVQDFQSHSQLVGRPTFGHSMEPTGHHHTQQQSAEMQRHRHSDAERSRQELMEDFHHSQGGTRVEPVHDLHGHSQLVGRPSFGHTMEFVRHLNSQV